MLQLTTGTTKLAIYDDCMHIAVVDDRLASCVIAAKFIHKTAYQTTFTFCLLQPTIEQRATA